MPKCAQQRATTGLQHIDSRFNVAASSPPFGMQISSPSEELIESYSSPAPEAGYEIVILVSNAFIQLCWKNPRIALTVQR